MRSSVIWEAIVRFDQLLGTTNLGESTGGGVRDCPDTTQGTRLRRSGKVACHDPEWLESVHLITFNDDCRDS